MVRKELEKAYQLCIDLVVLNSLGILPDNSVFKSPGEYSVAGVNKVFDEIK